ncbi:hypothetical protein [Paludibaculum fermentans]|uniref:Uncharacterized protein n=1 Tax=Paludibaculum fermentans TaxID=1473598 RepID=A0A7S7NXX3_PALFE|nr:hypothetical protein [Paludibaculum fermentans]QOY91820.1 hypothetical protein IRI77_18325 [Paludibaculum fermentans]
MEALTPLLTTDGILLDSFVEDTFCWSLARHETSEFVPYRQPWTGFVHNPPGIPEWHETTSAPQHILSLPAWQDSLPQCRGLFTFSAAMRDWLAARVAVPVEALIHPTECPAQVFDWERFLALQRPRIVQVGAWLRRIHSIARLDVSRLRKSCLIPRQDGAAYLEALASKERAHEPAAGGADWGTVEVLPYHDAAAFDELLSESVVFLDLYDTVVNNTVVECIVRGTPLVCNRLPALVELLGEEYPLYFSTLEEAGRKADDFDLIRAAAEYLRAIPKDVFTGEAFLRSVARSGIYRSLA